MRFTDICEMCSVCKFFYANNDMENQCVGKKEPCHEFVLFGKYAFLDKALPEPYEEEQE